MPSRLATLIAFAFLTLIVVGCAHTEEETSIAPLAPAAGRVDPGLGPGTRALSSGPGYKGSPSWSPGGVRIAFSVDGYVVDRPAHSGESRRWTTRDFVTRDIKWTSDDTLAVLGKVHSSGRKAPGSLYKASAGENPLQLERVARGVMAMGPDGEGLIYAFGKDHRRSGLALMDNGRNVYRLYENAIEGRVAALSL